MTKRKVYDNERHVHFVTFSCYHRRQLLQSDRAKRIVIGHLGAKLTRRNGLCIGFVIMPDHVHALVWFPETGQLSGFMNEWKGQTSLAIRQLYEAHFPEYWSKVKQTSVWQTRYYDFNVFTRPKLEEKLTYMHMNPVRAGLAQKIIDWPWSSARWYEQSQSVGVPISWPPGME